MSPAPGPDKKAEKSYLASTIDSINPWGGSRSSTPTPKEPKPEQQPPVNPGDHIVNPLYGQSSRRYPPDCPKLNVKWFHAVDIPKRKPKFRKGQPSIDADDKKRPTQPKKFVAFSPNDSKSIEAAYQKKLEELEDDRISGGKGVKIGAKRPRAVSAEETPNTSLEYGDEGQAKSSTRVPVNEDFLFDVEIETRELGPVYWLGPVYDVRRGSWFYQEGSTLRPCEENLAAQLEEGYLKIKPWRYPPRKNLTPKASVENLKADTPTQTDGQGLSKAPTAPHHHQPQTYRLFGTYMNSVATYQDASTAWLASDGVLSWVTSTVYERFAGCAYMSGVKVVRGYSEPKKAKEVPRPSTPTGTKSDTLSAADEKQQKMLKRRSAPPLARSDASAEDIFRKEKESEQEAEEPKKNILTRQLSNLMPGAEAPSKEEEAEAIRKQEEQQMEDDYTAQVGETQNREIEHLVLITHGIGQLLSLRMESLNFVHDINMLRKTLKTTYSSSDDLRALNSEIGESGPGNCRVQVLPVCWRHLLEFPKRREKKGEHDLSDTFNDEDEYPSLDDITIEGMAFARSLVSDLALDILLYQSAYREQICEIVLKESNRIYKLFMERNPDFKGKVHIMGHSLGSAIMFDILCRQKERSTEPSRNPLRFWPSSSQDRYEPSNPKELAFNFDVDDFYCLGSPIGLFQMLKGRNIAARHLPNSLPSESPLNPDPEDPFFSPPPPTHSSSERVSPITNLPFTVSSPKINQLYNIFHPSDPIAYRLEPLISKAMSALKPQALPYTKKGIFGNVAPQGLTGIGAKVGQSVSGLWSSFSAGVASSLLNRSLGLTQQDVAALERQQAAVQQANQQSQLDQMPGHTLSPGAGTNIGAGVISPAEVLSDTARAERVAERKRELALSRRNTGLGGKNERISESGNEVTLIDDELETLFSKFQKKRVDLAAGTGDDGREGEVKKEVGEVRNWAEEEKKAQKLRREEMKVRALNRNGRVDYTVQESVLDFNPMNVIASHMSYWQDEDVAHFTLSQMLASRSRTPRGGTPKATTPKK
ncbi:DDHD domain-containing protein [Coniochaeta sp. 2T2.1]|nr:DDHD domain-containing protein [Coniochaeta sp. 2T2.1]